MLETQFELISAPSLHLHLVIHSGAGARTTDHLITGHPALPPEPPPPLNLSLFKRRTSLQPAMGHIWDLRGDLETSLCTRPFTRHQVCYVDTSPSLKVSHALAPCLVCFMAPLYLLLPFQVLKGRGGPSSTRSGKTRTYIRPFYANSSTSHITSLWACRPLERTSPARTKNPSKAKLSLSVHATVLLSRDINLCYKKDR